LVVDDDEAIRQLMRDILTRHGFVVVSAVDGLEALTRFWASPKRFCAVITDMTMPRMNGAELAAVLGRTAPEVPIIIASSSLMPGEGGDKRALPLPPVACVLNRPYAEGALLEALSRVLAPR
jgi:CheY-like chemotaxis protein